MKVQSMSKSFWSRVTPNDHWRQHSLGNLSRISSLVGILFYLLVVLSGSPHILAEESATSNPLPWKLVWSDEFNYTGKPDPTKWNYELGFIRNNEPQCYTSRLKNAHVENGYLVLEARRESFLNFARGPKQKPKADYTSASLCTLGKQSWTYGRFEIRAKLPTAIPAWSAFWMVGENRQLVRWPACGEFDIMEHWGKRPNENCASINYLENGKKGGVQKGIRFSSPDDFHVYAMEWSPKQIDFFIDGEKYQSVPMNTIHDDGGQTFHLPFYIILNLALDPYATASLKNTSFPIRFIVDYVRVYQHSPSGY